MTGDGVGMRRLSSVRLGVRNKLFAGFAAVVVCTLVLGLVSMSKLGNTNAATAYIATNSLPSLKVTSLGANAARQLRADQAALVLATSPATRATLASNIRSDAATANGQANYYLAKLLTDARDRSNTQAVRSLLANYEKQTAPVEQLVNSGRTAAAGSILVAAAPVYQQLLAATNAWHDYNLTIGNNEYAHAEANYSSARTLVIVLIAAAVAIAIGIAFLLARGIMRSVNPVLHAARAIAREGDVVSRAPPEP